MYNLLDVVAVNVCKGVSRYAFNSTRKCTCQLDQSNKFRQCYLSKLVTGAFTYRWQIYESTLPKNFFLGKSAHSHICMSSAPIYAGRQMDISAVCSGIKSHCETVIRTIYTHSVRTIKVTCKSCLSYSDQVSTGNG